MTTSIVHSTSFVPEAEFLPDDSPEEATFTKRTLERTGFGAKEITFFGSVALLLNNITGAPIVDLPGLFQQAGWVTPIAMMIFMVLLSVQSSSMLCEAMAAMPNNARFQRRIEMSSLSKYYLPKWAYWLTQLLLNISLIVMNMSCIIVAAQSMDWLLLRTSSWVGALEMYPKFRFIALSQVDGAHVSPFDGMVVVSIGFVIVMIVSAPLGYWNLDENMWIQNVAFVITVVILVLWTVLFFFVGLVWSRIPAFGPDQTQVLGNMIFNYAFVTTVPSWVNEKKERVSINKSLWISVSLTTLLYIMVGITGGLALAISGDEDVLDALPNETKGAIQLISSVSCYAFPFIVLLPGIPVYSIIVRYNLLDAKVCGQGWANFWGVIFPWIISIFFCTGSGFTLVVNWTSLFVNGAINFLIPLYIYIEMKRRVARAGLAAAQASIQADDESRFAREASTVTSSLLNMPPADPHDPFPCFSTDWYHKRLSRYLPFNPVYIAWFLFTLTAELLIIVIVLNLVAVFK